MNDYRAYVENDYNSIYHFGIKGQKWGIRRYQNPDGSLTPEGKKRYLNPDGSLNERGRKELGRNYLKDRKYAGRVARGALGTAAAATYAYKRAQAEKITTKFNNEMDRIRKMHPSKQVLTSGTFVKADGNSIDRVLKIAKNREEADILEKAGYYLGNHKGKYVYMKDIVGTRGKDITDAKIPVHEIWSSDAKTVLNDAKKIEELQKQGYHLVPNKEFKYERIKNPIAEKKIADALKKVDNKSKKIAAAVLAAGIGATAISLYLHHKGVQKRKAEVEKLLMGSDNSDSSVTKRVKEDWNNLSDKDFKAKYGASKDKYAKRVAKYRDPYMNAPLAKLGKSLSKKKSSKNVNRVLTARKVNEYNEMRKNADYMKERNLEIAVNKNTGGLIYRSKDPSNRKVNSQDYVAIESEEDLMQILDRIRK